MRCNIGHVPGCFSTAWESRRDNKKQKDCKQSSVSMAACSSTSKFCPYMKRMLVPCVLLGELCSRRSLSPSISWWLVCGRNPWCSCLVVTWGKRAHRPHFCSVRSQRDKGTCKACGSTKLGGKVFRAPLKLHEVLSIFNWAGKPFPSLRPQRKCGGDM